MILQYEGTRYQGWQRQESIGNTIQGRLEALLTKMTGQEITLQGSGRTDAGVHALGQVANFHADTQMQADDMISYINFYLPEDIAVISLKEVPERFHSRLNAGAKTYLYRISTNTTKNVFERKYIYDFDEFLDVGRMKEAAAYLIGEHDFQGFCAKKIKKSTIRKLYSVEFRELPGELQISYRGSGFLYHMVRILTGTLIEVGKYERTPESVQEVLRARERAKAGYTAPAKGLCLMRVEY